MNMIATATIAGSVPLAETALASSHPDAELFRLFAKLRQKHHEVEKAIADCEAANERMKAELAHLPALPAEPRPPAEYSEDWKTITVGQMKMLPEDHPLVVWDRESAPEWTEWNKLSRARDRKASKLSGYTAAERRFNDIYGQEMEIGDEIFAMPALTIEGLSIKVQAMKVLNLDSEIMPECSSILENILAQAGLHSEAIDA